MAENFPLAIVLGAVDRLSGPLTKLETKLGSFGKKAAATGKKLTFGITAPTVALGALALTSFTSYETGMLRVQALTQSTATEQAALEVQTRALGKATAFSAGEVAGAQGFLAQAGFKVNDIIGATPGVLDLAAAAQMDLAQTADITSNVLTGYGKDVADLGDVNNILVRTFTQSNTSLEQLGESFKLAGPVASAMGLPMSETAAILGKMGDAGFQATLSGTALRGALTKLAKPSAEAVAALSGLKIRKSDIIDSQGNVKSLIDTVGILEASGATATDMLTIFGQRAGPAMTSLVQGGVASIRELQGNLLEGATAGEIAAIQLSGLGGKMALLKSAAGELAIVVGESGLVEWFGAMVVKATELIGKLGEADPKFLKMALVVTGVVAAIGPLLMIVGQASLGISALAAGGGFVLTVLSTLATTLFGVVIPAIWAFTTALLANPIGLIVVGVVALVAGLVLLAKKNETVKRALMTAWKAIGDFFGFIFGKIMAGFDALVGVAGAVGGFFGFGGDGVALGPNGASITPDSVFRTSAGVSLDRKESRIAVDFSEVPIGTRVTAEDLDDDVELGLGFALGGIA